MKRNELLKSPEYWTTALQMELYRQMDTFMKKHDMNRKQLAEYLGCSKGYISQLLAGDYDHKLSKFIELSLSIGKIPEINFVDVNEYIETESQSYSISTDLDQEFITATYEKKETNNYNIAA